MSNNVPSIWLKCSKIFGLKVISLKKSMKLISSLTTNSLETETIVNENELFIAFQITSFKKSYRFNPLLRNFPHP